MIMYCVFASLKMQLAKDWKDVTAQKKATLETSVAEAF